jgi:four helix bundle protein
MAGDFRGLIIWRLADELQTKTLKLMEDSRWKTDFELRGETDKTASQIKRCIAEGFRRTGHGDFARFLEYSNASLAELRSLYDDAYKKGYATGAQLQPLMNLCYRLERGLRRFIEELRRNSAPPSWNYGQSQQPRPADKRKRTDPSSRDRPKSAKRRPEDAPKMKPADLATRDETDRAKPE